MSLNNFTIRTQEAIRRAHEIAGIQLDLLKKKLDKNGVKLIATDDTINYCCNRYSQSFRILL